MHHQRGGQRQQQESEGRALLPVEARDELVVDLLGEPLRVLAAEQGRRQVVAEGQHEHDDAARGDAGRGVRNDDGPQRREAARAEIVGRLDQRVVQALQARDQRDQHEQQRCVDEAHQDGGIVIQKLDRHRCDAELHQQRRQNAGFAQQNHPPERADGLAHPERDQAYDEQERRGAAPGELRDDPGDGERQNAASAAWR